MKSSQKSKLDASSVNQLFEKILCKYKDSKDDLKHIKKLMKQYEINLNQVFINGIKLIHYICENRYSNLLIFIISQGADVNALDNDGFSPAHFAVCRGNNAIPCLEILAQAGANLNFKTRGRGYTPVHFLVESNENKTLKRLAELKADLTRTNYEGETPAYLAAKLGYLESLKILQEAGVDLTQPSANEKYPLQIAQGGSEVAKYLLSIYQKNGRNYVLSQNYHRATINMMKISGYKDVNQGVCHGFALSLVPGIFTKTLSMSNERIEKFPCYERTLASDLKEIAKKLEQKQLKQLTPKEYEITSSIQPYLGTVNSLQNPDELSTVIGKRFIPQIKSDLIWPLIESIELQKLGGLSYSDVKWCGVYTIRLLTYYIELLDEFVCRHKVDLAFEIGRCDHTLAIGYDSTQKQWWFIHSNSEIKPAQQVPVDFITYMIHQAFQTNPGEGDVVAMSTLPICLTREKNSIDALLTKFTSTVQFKKLHDITAENAKIVTCTGSSLALMAARIGLPKELKRLAQYGADFNRKDYRGKAPLYWASKNGFEDAARVLLENKADINQCDNDGMNPLHFAAGLGNTRMVKLLLAFKADRFKKDSYGKTPYDYAKQYSDITDLLDNKELIKACEKGDAKKVKTLIEAGADVNLSSSPSSHLSTHPLAAAIFGKSLECVKLLIEAKADVDQRSYRDSAALSNAAYENQTDIVDFLLEVKADPILSSSAGITPLYWAMLLEHNECFNLLIKSKPELAFILIQAKTPLEWSIEFCAEHACEKLLNMHAERLKDRVTPANNISPYVFFGLFKKNLCEDQSIIKAYKNYVSHAAGNITCEYLDDRTSSEEIASCFRNYFTI